MSSAPKRDTDREPAEGIVPMPEIAVANDASLLLAIGTFIASLFVRSKRPKR